MPPRSPPLASWPLMSTPTVLLSTHCVPSKSRRVKAAAVKVKTHLSAGLFVQGGHYAGFDQATQVQLQDKPTPPRPPLLSVSPGRCTPRVSSLFHCAPSLAEDLLPVYSLFNTPSFVFCFFFALTPSRLYATLSHNPLRISRFISKFPPLSRHFYFACLLFPSLIFCLSISSLIFSLASISFFFFLVWPRHPIVWKPAHPGPAPEPLRTAPWVMGIVYSH